MAKIKLDKYYTSPELAKYCVEKTREIIGNDNITEYIEPSAGSGVFLDYLDKPYLAYAFKEFNFNNIVEITGNYSNRLNQAIIAVDTLL